MRLQKCLDQNEYGETASQEVSSNTDIEQLKQLGGKLCRENGVLDAVWISGPKSWQELLSIGADGETIIHFVIRP